MRLSFISLKTSALSLLPGFLALAGGGIYLLFPSHLLAGLFRLSLAEMERLYPILLWGLLSASMAAWGLRRLTVGTATEPAEQFEKNARVPTWLLGIGVSLLVLSALENLARPMNWDELRAAAIIPRSSLFRILSLDPSIPDFFPSPNHTLSNALAFLSVKILGISVEAFRLPSVVVTFLLGICIAWMARKWWSFFTAILVFSHLLSNLPLRWYLSSHRGYLLLICFCLLSFYLSSEVFRRKGDVSNVVRVGLLLSLLGGICSHTFGILFAVSVVVALLAGWNLSLEVKSRSEKSADLIFGILLLVPIALAVGLREARVLLGFPGNFADGFSWSHFQYVMHAFGLGDFRVAKLGVILVIYLLLRRCQMKRLSEDFPAIFVISSACVIAFSVLVLNASNIKGRFLLGFVIPLLIFVGESVGREKSFYRRFLLGTLAFAVFSLGPAMTLRSAAANSVIGNNQVFLLGAWQASGYADPECFESVGESSDIFLFLSLRPLPKPKEELCPRQFKVVGQESPKDLLETPGYEIIFADHLGNSLRERRPGQAPHF